MNSINSFFPTQIAEALGWTLLHSLWQAVVISFVAALALITLRHQRALIRYRLANLSLLAVVIAAICTFGLYYESPDTTLSIFPEVAAIESTGPVQILDQQDFGINSDSQSILEASTWQSYFSPHLPLIVTIWFVGMSIFLLRLLSNFAYVHYLKTHLVYPVEVYWEEVLDRLLQKTGITKNIQLLESALVPSPVLAGYFKPVILFPVGMINRLELEEAEAILAHELAHILHHDFLLNLFQSLVEALFYFNPAVWWLSAKIRQEREMAADATAIELTGDSVGFAKALVLMQEMAFARGAGQAALAFAGNGKSELFHRVRHILNIKSPKNFNMEKIVGTLAVILALMGLGYTEGKNTDPQQEISIDQLMDNPDAFNGVWQGEIENGKLCLNLSRRQQNNSWSWSSNDCFPVSEFSALPKEGVEGEFSMTRPAGKMVFTGKFENKEGYGKFSFTPDQEFITWLEQQGVTDMDENAMILLFFAKTDRAYITALQQAGYDRISGDDLAALAVHQVDLARIKAYKSLAERLGDPRPSLETMVGLSIHDVTPEYAKQMESIGFKTLNLEDVMSFKIHEITPEYVKQLSSMGFPGLNADDVMGFKIHEITPEYVQQVHDMGFPNLNAEDIMSFKIHEVTPAYLESLKQSGLTNLSPDEVMSLKIQGVSPQTVEKFRDMGFTDLSQDDIIGLQIHEVSPEFLEEMRQSGFSNLSVDEAMTMKIHGIQANYVADLKAAGFDRLTVDDVVSCKIHEISAAYVSELKKAGFNNLSVDDAIGCKIHGVSPEQVKTLNQLGFKNISIDDAMSLKIHDVTSEFITKMREKGFKDLSLDDYIELKIRFGDKLE